MAGAFATEPDFTLAEVFFFAGFFALLRVAPDFLGGVTLGTLPSLDFFLAKLQLTTCFERHNVQIHILS